MVFVICAAFLVMACCYLLFERDKRVAGFSRPLHIGVKCAATAMAVLVALLGCLRNGVPAHWLMLAGLAACAVADGVLCARFMAGVAVFALGHILYMTGFCLMHLPAWRSVVMFLLLMGLATAAFTRWKKRFGRRAPFFYAYATVLSVMVSLSASQRPLFFAGALLFAFSDATLGYLMIDRNHVKLDYISLAAYYLGQFLLALGVFVG